EPGFVTGVHGAGFRQDAMELNLVAQLRRELGKASNVLLRGGIFLVLGAKAILAVDQIDGRLWMLSDRRILLQVFFGENAITGTPAFRLIDQQFLDRKMNAGALISRFRNGR